MFEDGANENIKATLCIHSSKAHLLQSLNVAGTVLADAVIRLAMEKGELHRVMLSFYFN
jgi:hypothetical protein